MAMQAGKIQLVHYSAAREYGLKPGHAQLTRFFRDQIDAALFDGCDAQPEIWNGFQRLCLADDVESKVTLPDVARLGGPFDRAVIEQQDAVTFLNAYHGAEVMGMIAITVHSRPYKPETRSEGKGVVSASRYRWLANQ